MIDDDGGEECGSVAVVGVRGTMMRTTMTTTTTTVTDGGEWRVTRRQQSQQCVVCVRVCGRVIPVCGRVGRVAACYVCVRVRVRRVG